MTAITCKCPTCAKKTEYSTENAFRPFCSKRCKLIDLGAWASEDYRIPSSPQEGYSADAETAESHEQSSGSN